MNKISAFCFLLLVSTNSYSMAHRHNTQPHTYLYHPRQSQLAAFAVNPKCHRLLETNPINTRFFANFENSKVTATELPSIPNIVFLWDLNKVILERDKQNQWKTFLSYPNKWKIFTNFQLMKEIVGLRLKKKATDKITSTNYLDLAEKNHSPEFKELILLLETAYRPIPGTITLIERLKKLGYSHHIGSNFDSRTFDAMCPDIQKFFADNFDPKYTQIVSSSKKDPIKKPDPRFFEEYLKKISEDFKNPNIVFIDDSSQNTTAASKLGFKSFRFTSPDELLSDLVAYLTMKQVLKEPNNLFLLHTRTQLLFDHIKQIKSIINTSDYRDMSVVDAYLEEIKALLGNGVDINAQDENGNTILDYALNWCFKREDQEIKKQDVVDFLKTNGAQ